MDLSNAVLNKLSVHIVGNKGLGQEILLSKKPIDLPGNEKKMLAKAFDFSWVIRRRAWALT